MLIVKIVGDGLTFSNSSVLPNLMKICPDKVDSLLSKCLETNEVNSLAPFCVRNTTNFMKIMQKLYLRLNSSNQKHSEVLEFSTKLIESLKSSSRDITDYICLFPTMFHPLVFLQQELSNSSELDPQTCDQVVLKYFLNLVETIYSFCNFYSYDWEFAYFILHSILNLPKLLSASKSKGILTYSVCPNLWKFLNVQKRNNKY